MIILRPMLFPDKHRALAACYGQVSEGYEGLAAIFNELSQIKLKEEAIKESAAALEKCAIHEGLAKS